MVRWCPGCILTTGLSGVALRGQGRYFPRGWVLACMAAYLRLESVRQPAAMSPGVRGHKSDNRLNRRLCALYCTK